MRGSHPERREVVVAGAPWWEEFGAATAPPATGTVEAPAPPVTHHPGPPPAAPVPRPPRGLQVTAAVLSVVLLALLGLLAARRLAAPGPPTAAGTGVPTAVSALPSPTAATAAGGSGTPGASGSSRSSGSSRGAAADAAATAELQRLRQQGLTAHPPRGQWVAQLAAKSVGTTDPGQTAANGSSTFYAADILAQSRQIASGVAGGDVFVLRTTDFGDGLVDARGNPYWVTLAAGPFADADDVRTWCASMFADTPAGDRGNVCLPKQLTPPGGR
ncbi:hypothetical protein [Kineococcus aurantiacus]|uniref:Uncharacterized protein n=1 Tax=Kineococcus aurantiacus TaxID=37633 RepID=A0A7Y9J0G2_9ACTN|nr:hypothetical protein [Kineococcus aurantiacus]NYD22297.1 hypothetical protein [Kineococcus aurantiacus]